MIASRPIRPGWSGERRAGGRADVFDVPADAQLRQTGGRGSLISRVRWEHPDGSTATWESRQARKRGFIEVIRDGIVERIRARPAVAVRLRPVQRPVRALVLPRRWRCSPSAPCSAQYEAAAPATIDWTFLVGGFFFSTGAYAALVQEINSPRGIGADGALAETRLALVGVRAEPARLDGGLRAVLRHPGLRDQPGRRRSSSDLTGPQDNRLIWAPEMVGCVLFLVSGHIGIIEVCHGRFRLMPRVLGWWIVIVNQLGSWLFFALRAGRLRAAGHR